MLVNGRDLRDWDLAMYRGQLGAVTQEDTLFLGSIADAIAFGGEFDMNEIKQCARLAQIDAEISIFPMGYSTLVGALGSTLSGGQKQRVLLARALYRHPQVLFLDETLDQIDTGQESLIRSNLASTVSTIVLVSHRTESVQNVRQILLK